MKLMSVPLVGVVKANESSSFCRLQWGYVIHERILIIAPMSPRATGNGSGTIEILWGRGADSDYPFQEWSNGSDGCEPFNAKQGVAGIHLICAPSNLCDRIIWM